jgi:tetratricopeptide (TPR) repeat protein
MGDASKLIDRAEKLLEKGKPELALADYRSAIELQPGNEQLLQKTADLSMSLGQLGVASDMLRRLFAHWIDRKELGSAGVVFRKLQRMKALDPEMVMRYAELCENTNRKEAAEAYRVAFDEFQRLGDPRRSLECISQSLEMDPRLEDYREQARISEALHEPVLAAVALVHLGVMLERLDQDASEAYSRAYANDPGNMAARLGHGRALIAHDRPAEAVELLQPLATYPSSPEEAREPYALALLAVGRVEEAEPFAWGLFERNPSGNLEPLHAIIGGLVDRDRVDKALGLARRLEEFYRKAGRRNEFMQDMARLAETSKPSIPFFEYLAELYNSANRELDYSQVLSRLFDLYFEVGNHARALDALDRAVDIDPYEAEHKDRMQKLAGHAPEDRLQIVARRLGIDPPEQVTVTDEASASETPAPKVLEDLILQAEIFLQYGMRDKALQKIEQIKHSFASDLESNPRVRQLFINAGLAAPVEREEPAERNRASDGMVRAAEVSRLIARQSDPRSVLVTAVNQIGARWQYSRCLAALATPGKPPSLVVEYCSPEVTKSERTAMVRLLALSQRLTSIEPVFRAADVQLSEPLSPIRPELARLGVHSLVILSLLNEDQPIGLLIVQQCGARRRWSSDDVALLRSLADQVALAVHGARLRSLVSTLGVAEEKTGLLKRSSYIDAVVSELGRQRAGEEIRSTLALLQVAALTSSGSQTEYAVTELVRTLRSVAQDQAMLFRYDRDTVALLLPHMEVAETEALVGQLREALEIIAVTITAGIAQAGAFDGFEPEDAATEWINRVARALTVAATLPERLCSLPPTQASIT